LNAVDRLGYRGGGTSILAALQAAVKEINTYSKHNLTVVGEYPSYSTSAFESVSDVKGDAVLLNLAQRTSRKRAITRGLI
jgi:hypothetical protein